MRVGNLVVAAIVGVAAFSMPAGSVSVAEPGVIDQPVAFSVVNENRSAVPCEADGRTYLLRGSLVAPASTPKDVTILVPGAMLSGDKLWQMRPQGDTSYDFALQLARQGHAVVSFDLVGYGSGVDANGPQGQLVCQGSEADVIHQVAEDLRNGTYQHSGGGATPTFGRVALLGFSFGTQYAQVAAYSFPQDIAALVLAGWAEPYLPSPDGAQLIGSFTPCFTGPGVSKYANGTGPGGYVKLSGQLAVKVQWSQPEPAAETDWIDNVEADPCGINTTTLARAASDVTGLPRITVPVLLAFGQDDALVGWMGPHVLYDRLTGSNDKTLMIFPGAGHSYFLERNRLTWDTKISGWLTKHGF